MLAAVFPWQRDISQDPKAPRLATLLPVAHTILELQSEWPPLLDPEFDCQHFSYSSIYSLEVMVIWDEILNCGSWNVGYQSKCVTVGSTSLEICRFQKNRNSARLYNGINVTHLQLYPSRERNNRVFSLSETLYSIVVPAEPELQRCISGTVCNVKRSSCRSYTGSCSSIGIPTRKK